MKNFFILLLTILFIPLLPVNAEEEYIRIDPLPYSVHVLGEDLIIKGETNIPLVNISLRFPDIPGYSTSGSIFSDSISDLELKEGLTIPTGAHSRLWPEGHWRFNIGTSETNIQFTIYMAASAPYDRKVIISEYEADSLMKTTSYPCRYITFKNNVISFSTSDGKLIKIFSWDNLKPTFSGNTRLFIAEYENGFLNYTKSCTGTISNNGSVELDISPDKKLKIMYWQDYITPVTIEGE